MRLRCGRVSIRESTAAAAAIERWTVYLSSRPVVGILAGPLASREAAAGRRRPAAPTSAFTIATTARRCKEAGAGAAARSGSATDTQAEWEGRVWPRVVACGRVWSRVVACGRVWPRMAPAQVLSRRCLRSGWDVIWDVEAVLTESVPPVAE